MILKTNNNRVILWGCQIGHDSVLAGLSFFSSNLSTKQVSIASLDGNRITIELPDTVLNQNMPCKLLPNQMFKRVD